MGDEPFWCRNCMLWSICGGINSALKQRGDAERLSWHDNDVYVCNNRQTTAYNKRVTMEWPADTPNVVLDADVITRLQFHQWRHEREVAREEREREISMLTDGVVPCTGCTRPSLSYA